MVASLPKVPAIVLEIGTTGPPTAEELAVLREMDPDRVYIA